MRRVLFAHQSTIPHYRIALYNALEKNRPSTWAFDVVFDPQEFVKPRIFTETVHPDSFNFPILETSTVFLPPDYKRPVYQTFWREAARYDLLILENALNNLTYPLCHLHQLHKTKIAYWGHGRDLNTTKITTAKRLSEAFKLWLCKRADGFFAYTPGVKSYLVGKGVAAEKIFAVNNTIDIVEQRAAFERFLPRREQWREQMGVAGKDVLLFIGRFSKRKRLDFLFEACSSLERQRANTHLLLVGSGSLPDDVPRPQNLTLFDAITDVESLGSIYAGSDLFVHPGAVGLAPLQALCYDLPVITIEQAHHKPEVEYLNAQNALILPERTSPTDFAAALMELLDDRDRLTTLRQSCWPSICQYTIDAMAQNFIRGISTLLQVDSAPYNHEQTSR